MKILFNKIFYSTRLHWDRFFSRKETVPMQKIGICVKCCNKKTRIRVKRMLKKSRICDIMCAGGKAYEKKNV